MIDKLLKYLFKTLICLVLMSMTMSCGRDSRDDSPLPPDEPEPGTVTVALSARAFDAMEISDTPYAERMHNIRIVILSRKDDEQWIVEHNYFEGFSSGTTVSGTRQFKVKANAKKRIYIIANGGACEIHNGATPLEISDGSLYIPDSNGLSVIDRATFSIPEDSALQSIPMTAVYELEVEDKDTETKCSLVRAVNKLTLSVNNATQTPTDPANPSSSLKRSIRLLGWSLDKTAADNYLMPHVNKNAAGAYWVADTDRNTEIALSGNWVDWLAEETKKNQETDILRYQWLTDYEIPAGTERKPMTYIYETAPQIDADGSSTSYTAPAVYFTESSERIDGNPLKLQEYTFTLFTEERYEGDSEWKKRQYTAVLPQVASLFRNTHVVINASINYYYDFTLKVEEQPYSYVNLNPDFGLDRDDDGNIIIKRPGTTD